MDSDLDLDLHFALQEALAASPSSSSSTLPNLQRQQPFPDDAVLNPTALQLEELSPAEQEIKDPSRAELSPFVGKFCAKSKGDSDIDEDEPQTQIVDDVDQLISCMVDVGGKHRAVRWWSAS
ncbi:hypothetical protein RIF29_14920 [Crotalaria pallida]|uniref:Uncharacterized protein n=1 Tax=Crotalaria pallida TaxID=3830 RepID=A0AAN9FGC4_CROPI